MCVCMTLKSQEAENSQHTVKCWNQAKEGKPSEAERKHYICLLAFYNATLPDQKTLSGQNLLETCSEICSQQTLNMWTWLNFGILPQRFKLFTVNFKYTVLSKIRFAHKHHLLSEEGHMEKEPVLNYSHFCGKQNKLLTLLVNYKTQPLP